ncbi:MAG: alternative ribosome rescue aminoacyl-tRNA hydrolase ArfB [Pseudomonadota bacterium]
MTIILDIAPGIAVHDSDVQWQAIRSQGAGGQHVNKTSSAVELRFDIAHSRLPFAVRQRLLSASDQRVTASGILILKAQQSRSQFRNRSDALARLAHIIRAASVAPKKRKPTRPSAASKRRRLEQKRRRSGAKRMRSRPRAED